MSQSLKGRGGPKLRPLPVAASVVVVVVSVLFVLALGQAGADAGASAKAPKKSLYGAGPSKPKLDYKKPPKVDAYKKPKAPSYKKPKAPSYKSAYSPPYDEKKPEPPGLAYDGTCKYDEPAWSDCDPFHLMRWRNKILVSGGTTCEAFKNETRACGQDQFPQATRWLIAEHKKCISQLEHLKNMISDMHRWIDLIHERGQAMYHAFNELRKHLEDIQRKIKEHHRQNHDNANMLARLRKELSSWKEKSQKLQTALETLKTKFQNLEKEHLQMRKEFDECEHDNTKIKREGVGLAKRIGVMVGENRELKGRLLDAEHYHDLVVKARARIAQLEGEIKQLKHEIGQTKLDLQKCRIDLMNAKNRKPPSYNKDTHVNLDMQMWITHNQTKEKYEQEHKQPYEKQYQKMKYSYTTTAAPAPAYKAGYHKSYKRAAGPYRTEEKTSKTSHRKSPLPSSKKKQR